MADVATWALAVLATLAAGGALVLRDDRSRAAAMALALALAVALIAADSWDDERFRDLRDHAALLAAAALAGALVIAALALVIRRHPEALPLLAIAALPFRVPIESGGESANLLLPLYAVIAAGTVAALAGAWTRPREPEAPPGAFALRWLPLALAGFIVLYAIQGIHSDDFSQAASNAGFFLAPFAVLAALLGRVEWSGRVLRYALAIVVAEAILFAIVAFAEYGMRELLWNPTIIEANEIHAHFRVNSLFWDPNVFGRYLAVTIVAVVAVMLWQRTPRTVAGAGGLALVLLAALATTLSQSSLVALLAGLAVLAGLRWSARLTAAVCAGALVAAVVALAASGAFDSDASSRKSIDVETSGRWELIRGGLEMAADDPVAGLGSGGFERAFQKRFRAGEEAAGTVSHTEPVTVLAEQGGIGFAVYLAVVAIAFAALACAIRPYAPGLPGGGGGLDPPDGLVVGIARATLLAALAAMFVHSLSYAAFFTDPITWVLLAIGLVLARR
ncbi:MAG TPA: O-antigen ligase family protein [Solirubrobacterales bacterium]